MRRGTIRGAQTLTTFVQRPWLSFPGHICFVVGGDGIRTPFRTVGDMSAIFKSGLSRSEICRRWLGQIGLATSLVAVTTGLLLQIYLRTQSEHLIFGYFLPISFVAARHGSLMAILTAVASDLCAAYYLYPPDFSIYIDDPLQVAELTFFSLLVLATCQFIGGIADDERLRLRKRAAASE